MLCNQRVTTGLRVNLGSYNNPPLPPLLRKCCRTVARSRQKLSSIKHKKWTSISINGNVFVYKLQSLSNDTSQPFSCALRLAYTVLRDEIRLSEHEN
jgi:hypothetical protein